MNSYLKPSKFKVLKGLVPLKVKVILLNAYRRLIDLKLSFTKEVPLLFVKNKRNMPSNDSGKIYDCFYFFDELEILELRLNILNDFVDYFVICEANLTFSGKEKEYVFQQNRSRFEKFEEKIIYVPLDWSPTTRDEARSVLHDSSSKICKLIAQRTLTSPNVPTDEENNHWLTEYFQKESLHLALQDCEDEDIIFISDVDEIWNPNRSFRVKPDRIYVFKQVPYIYYLNNKSSEHWHSWTGSIVSRYGKIKNLAINDARTHGRLNRLVILKGGWHFSFQGGVTRIAHKLASYGHQELNVPEVLNDIENIVSSNKDIRGRKIRYRKSNKGLPEFLLQNFQDYRKMLL
jgi:beta-1,4-mannosyl-glycoprotein beta-1,4-N-acetylglucosaminyltransferase